MASTASFTRFGDLPKELRIQIWENASFFQRIMELKYCVVDMVFSIPGPPPAILLVNQESREVALKFYNKSFGAGDQSGEIYFNPVSDIIYLSSRLYEDELAAITSHFISRAKFLPQQDRIQTIAIAEKWWADGPDTTFFALRGVLENIRRFRSINLHLKQVILVSGAPSEGEVVSWDSYSDISLLPPGEMETEDKRVKYVLWAINECQRDRGFPKLDVVLMKHP
ncbi:hypothetical protein ACMFMG_008989 [Clarireedia jacksonii]